MLWTSGSSESGSRRAQIPEGVRIYAIGDVHGRVDLLDRLLAKIDADIAAHPSKLAIHVFLGDYIDRGPTSRTVLDRVIARSSSHQSVCLKGNHEDYLSEFLRNPAIFGEWARCGGITTLMSYGLSPSTSFGSEDEAKLAYELSRILPHSHRKLLSNGLRPFFICGDFFFVHAGVKPGVPLNQQREQDLLWIREEFLLHEQSFSKIVVHGHTPVLQPEIRFNRINIDTGAYATGNLTCLVLENDKLFFL